MPWTTASSSPSRSTRRRSTPAWRRRRGRRPARRARPTSRRRRGRGCRARRASAMPARCSRPTALRKASCARTPRSAPSYTSPATSTKAASCAEGQVDQRLERPQRGVAQQGGDPRVHALDPLERACRDAGQRRERSGSARPAYSTRRVGRSRDPAPRLGSRMLEGSSRRRAQATFPGGWQTSRRRASRDLERTVTAAFVDRHELVGGFDRDRLDEALERLREHDVTNVLVSMCDGSGVSRVEGGGHRDVRGCSAQRRAIPVGRPLAGQRRCTSSSAPASTSSSPAAASCSCPTPPA